MHPGDPDVADLVDPRAERPGHERRLRRHRPVAGTGGDHAHRPDRDRQVAERYAPGKRVDQRVGEVGAYGGQRVVGQPGRYDGTLRRTPVQLGE